MKNKQTRRVKNVFQMKRIKTGGKPITGISFNYGRKPPENRDIKFPTSVTQTTVRVSPQYFAGQTAARLLAPDATQRAVQSLPVCLSMENIVHAWSPMFDTARKETG